MTDENKITTGAPINTEEAKAEGPALVDKAVVVQHEDDVKLVEDEVPQKVINSQVTHTLPKDIDYNTEIKSFIGADQSAIKSYLDTLKANGVIRLYKIVPIGAPTTLEMRAGAVTVVVDSTGKIIDIEIS